MKTKIVGILGLHGSREEHAEAMKKLGYETKFLRTPEDFNNISGIILPGGESGSFGRVLGWSGIRYILEKKILEEEIPVFGTCAGSILLAKKGSEYSMGAIDIDVDRNAYGRQVDSFSADISLQTLGVCGAANPKGQNGKLFHAIFIRAPKITRVGETCTILAEHEGNPILVQDEKKRILIATFHPELTNDTRIHELFAEMIELRSGS